MTVGGRCHKWIEMFIHTRLQKHICTACQPLKCTVYRRETCNDRVRIVWNSHTSCVLISSSYHSPVTRAHVWPHSMMELCRSASTTSDVCTFSLDTVSLELLLRISLGSVLSGSSWGIYAVKRCCGLYRVRGTVTAQWIRQVQQGTYCTTPFLHTICNKRFGISVDTPEVEWADIVG